MPSAVTAYPWEVPYLRPAWLRPEAYTQYDDYLTLQDHISSVWNNPYSTEKYLLAEWITNSNIVWNDLMAYNSTLGVPLAAATPAPVGRPLAPRRVPASGRASLPSPHAPPHKAAATPAPGVSHRRATGPTPFVPPSGLSPPPRPQADGGLNFGTTKDELKLGMARDGYEFVKAEMLGKHKNMCLFFSIANAMWIPSDALSVYFTRAEQVGRPYSREEAVKQFANTLFDAVVDAQKADPVTGHQDRQRPGEYLPIQPNQFGSDAELQVLADLLNSCIVVFQFGLDGLIVNTHRFQPTKSYEAGAVCDEYTTMYLTNDTSLHFDSFRRRDESLYDFASVRNELQKWGKTENKAVDAISVAELAYNSGIDKARVQIALRDITARAGSQFKTDATSDGPGSMTLVSTVEEGL